MQLPETFEKQTSPPRIGLSITVLSYEHKNAENFVDEILRVSGEIFKIGEQTVQLFVKIRDLKDLKITIKKIASDCDEESRILEQNDTLFQGGEVLVFLQSKDDPKERDQLIYFLEHLSRYNNWLNPTNKPSVYLLATSIFTAKDAQSYELKSENKELIKTILEKQTHAKIKHLINIGSKIITRSIKNSAGLKQLDFYNIPSFIDLIEVISLALAHRDNSDIESLNLREASLAKHTPYPGYFHSLQPITDFCYALEKGNFVNLKEVFLDDNGLKTIHLQEILATLMTTLKNRSLKKLSLAKNNLDDKAIDALVSLVRSGQCADDFVLELNGNSFTEVGKNKLATIRNHLKTPDISPRKD